MKAELSLPERPSVLYLVAVVDVLAVLLVFFALIPVVAQQAGIVLEPAEIKSRLPTMAGKVTLTVRSGPQPMIRLGMKKVTLEELPEALRKAKESAGIEAVVFIPDKNVNFEMLGEIGEIILDAELDVLLGGAFPVEPSSPEERNR